MSISGASLLTGASRVNDDVGVAYLFCTHIPGAMYLRGWQSYDGGTYNQGANTWIPLNSACLEHGLVA